MARTIRIPLAGQKVRKRLFDKYFAGPEGELLRSQIQRAPDRVLARAEKQALRHIVPMMKLLGKDIEKFIRREVEREQKRRRSKGFRSDRKGVLRDEDGYRVL